MPKELLDRVERRPGLHLAERPSVSQAIRVDALLDPGLGREPLAERADVAVPEGLPLSVQNSGCWPVSPRRFRQSSQRSTASAASLGSGAVRALSPSRTGPSS